MKNENKTITATPVLFPFDLYQLEQDENGKRVPTGDIVTVYAATLPAAYVAAADLADDDSNPLDDYVIYPHLDKNDPATILRLSAYAVRRHHAWELANDYAATVALNRSTHDVEDEHGTAHLAVWESLTKTADTRAAYYAARRALDVAKRALVKTNNGEYNPDRALADVLAVREYRNTFPALAALVREACENVKLSDSQRAALEFINNGVSTTHAMEIMGIKRDTFYGHHAAARYRVLAYVLALSDDDTATLHKAAKAKDTACYADIAARIPRRTLSALAAANIPATDALDTLAALYRRAAKLNRW